MSAAGTACLALIARLSPRALLAINGALLLAGALLVATNARAADAPAATPAPAAGTTIVGEREAAVGLYLLPWKEEAPSDIDRAPRSITPAAAPIDSGHFAERVMLDEYDAAHRRVRVEPKTF